MRVFGSILVAAASMIGCVAAEGDESFIIINNLVPEVDEDTGAATFTPNREGPFFSQLGVGFGASSVFVGSLFESRVQAAEGRESLRTILIEGASIRLEVGPVFVEKDNIVTSIGETDVHTIEVPFSSALSPNGGLAVGIYDLVPFQIMASVRAKAGDAIFDIDAATRVQIKSTTTAFGDFYGDPIESTSFSFPVFVEQRITCGDLVCDPARETLTTCPLDCICGNGVCDTDRGEDTASCLVDCPAP